MNVFVAVTLEYWRILKQKRELKTRVQLPRNWFGTSIWPSCHGQGSQFLFFEEKDVSLTGEERGGHKLKIPQPLSLYPAPIKKKRINRNEKNTHLRVFQEYVEYDWVRAHAVLGRTVNKEWDSGFGLVTKWVSENYSGIVKRKASCSFIALTHSELQIFRSKAKLKFSSFLILIWILRGLEPNRYVQRYKQHHGKVLLR